MQSYLLCIILLIPLIFHSCVQNSNNDNNNGEIIMNVVDVTDELPTETTSDILYTTPQGAIGYYSITIHEFQEFFRLPSIELLNSYNKNYAYFLSSELDGYIIMFYTSGETTGNIDYTRVGQYNFGEYYYDILSDKQAVSQIISSELTEEDILDVAVVEYETSRQLWDAKQGLPGAWPEACFYVHTAKGDYILNDEESYDENDNTVHSWSAEQIGQK